MINFKQGDRVVLIRDLLFLNTNKLIKRGEVFTVLEVEEYRNHTVLLVAANDGDIHNLSSYMFRKVFTKSQLEVLKKEIDIINNLFKNGST